MADMNTYSSVESDFHRQSQEGGLPGTRHRQSGSDRLEVSKLESRAAAEGLGSRPPVKEEQNLLPASFTARVEVNIVPGERSSCDFRNNLCPAL